MSRALWNGGEIIKLSVKLEEFINDVWEIFLGGESVMEKIIQRLKEDLEESADWSKTVTVLRSDLEILLKYFDEKECDESDN